MKKAIYTFFLASLYLINYSGAIFGTFFIPFSKAPTVRRAPLSIFGSLDADFPVPISPLPERFREKGENPPIPRVFNFISAISVFWSAHFWAQTTTAKIMEFRGRWLAEPKSGHLTGLQHS